MKRCFWNGDALLFTDTHGSFRPVAGQEVWLLLRRWRVTDVQFLGYELRVEVEPWAA